MRAAYLECGKIINTHGIDGAVKLESWCDSPEVLASLERVYFKNGGDYEEREVLRASVFKQFVIAKIQGIGDIDAAQSQVGRVIYATREDFELEEGDYFIADLVGLDIIDADSGKVLGKLREVINRGASDIYIIDTPDGERMMPAVGEFVDRVDLEHGIYVRPIEGMF
ncbi:MAG: 16S rRNA processing protein RimM [Clostridia bacterium]|nr:16S rRNA processing protein RimM [Clostridia bacterium]